ncbi:putative quinol monooxygenase [Propionivibrio soli]|jgi:quinol monooxygenase YgiN|uniref:putative quinol monooxygenase n=1 Tax=Propionivibrio soli TaxID=2976531 RepID=UPI0021E97148|nr:putative quinol monooxygenase [Propionivibrio soli]
MIVVTAIFDARPGCEAKLEAALRELVGKVAPEPGALEYALHRSPTAPGRFYFYERYRDQAAVDVHMATPYLKRVLELVPELCACAPTVDFYEPLVSIAELR